MSRPVTEAAGLVTRSDVTLSADPTRVVAQLFVPGHEQLLDRESRATGVLARLLALPEDDVTATLREVQAGYSDRHRDLPGVFRSHYERIAHRLPDGDALTEDRQTLIGALFTHEFSVAGAALCNPSAVQHPDQSGLPAGQLRFVLSLRAIGEGHLSSVEFRTGVLGGRGELIIEHPGQHVEVGRTGPTTHDRELLAARLVEEGADAESARYLLRCLPGRFQTADLEDALARLVGQRLTRHGAARTAALARRIVSCSYQVEFPPVTSLAERVLWPQAPSECRGIEDARFVRFVEDDGRAGYRATYTAFDGAQIAPQLIETADFLHFRMSQLAGPAARNKGMALFPRRVRGRHLALSRWDRENVALASSVDGRRWDDAGTLFTPNRPWELIQTGNCGSPVETAAGWLVLTHGVGPMREYAIGALLLDLDDPSRVIGGLAEPLLRAAPDERDGYVPNVVYSCGPLLHGDQLLLPYGISDSAVRFAFIDVPGLLARLTGSGSLRTTRRNSSA